MKKNLFYLCALMFSVSLFTACSDDDNGNGTDATTILLDKVNATYEGTSLDLDYSGSSMTGKSVTFASVDGKKGTLTMRGAGLSFTREANGGLNLSNPGVIPGEAATVLEVDLEAKADGFSFKGVEKKENYTINYDGSVKEGLLDIDLEVEMAANELVGTWNLKIHNADDPSDKGAINPGWTSKNPFKVSLWQGAPPMDYQPEGILAFASITPLIPTADPNTKLNAQTAIIRLLQKVEFRKDGNLVATYSEKENLLNPVWNASPMNMVQFAVKNEKLMLYLNADEIIKAVMSPKSTKAAQEYNPMNAILKILPNLLQLTPMLEAGIPLSYRFEDDNTLLVYIDKELGMQLLNAVLPLFEDQEFIDYIKNATANTEMGMFAGMFDALLTQFPQVVAGTETMELGLRFVK